MYSYPIISTTPHQRAKLILIAVLVLHAGLAVAIKILFFAHKSPATKKVPPGKSATSPAGKGDAAKGNDKGADDDANDDARMLVSIVRMLLRI